MGHCWNCDRGYEDEPCTCFLDAKPAAPKVCQCRKGFFCDVCRPGPAPARQGVRVEWNNPTSKRILLVYRGDKEIAVLKDTDARALLEQLRKVLGDE